MSEAYEDRLEKFTAGKDLVRLSRRIRNRADACCDACGSAEPRVLVGLKDKESDRYFFVGTECLKWICQRGKVWRGFSKESASEAFEREMATRSEETSSCSGDRSSSEAKPLEVIPVGDAGALPPQPQVYLWETDESYVALVRIRLGEKWVWGSAETPRLHGAWEGYEDGGVVLRQVIRDRSIAVKECVQAAVEEAQRRPAGSQDAGLPGVAPLGNGHRDWTRFWRAMRGLGIQQDELRELCDGLMPRDWLRKHPESSLDDLLSVVREKHEQGGICSSVRAEAALDTAGASVITASAEGGIPS